MYREVAATNTAATRTMTPAIPNSHHRRRRPSREALGTGAVSGSSEISSDNSGSAVLETGSTVWARSLTKGTQAVTATALSKVCLGSQHDRLKVSPHVWRLTSERPSELESERRARHAGCGAPTRTRVPMASGLPLRVTTETAG